MKTTTKTKKEREELVRSQTFVQAQMDVNGAKKRKKKGKELVDGPSITIKKPNMPMVAFRLVGTSPYVQNKFTQKAKDQMREKQLAGTQAKKSTKRKPRDFKADYEGAKYKPSQGNWPNGAIPATAIRAAMIAAVRLVDFKMTDAKQCVFVEADGYDFEEWMPLIRITKGKPQSFEQALRVANGNPDLRVRPLWVPGWETVVRIRYDADRFQAEDVANLLMRAGLQVGIGEGRNASRSCVGLGWGAFTIAKV